MTIKHKFVFAFLLGALGLATVAGIASATHPRPKGATPVRVSLVPAFKQCTSPNSTHGSPLAAPSCSPPAQASSYLTVGTPDANDAAANSVGSVRFDVKATSPEDLLFRVSVSDVRCKPATSATVCQSANASDGPDYSGELQANMTIRISDHYNGPNLDQAATLQDLPNPLNVPCTNTADTSIGSNCNIQSSSSAYCPPVCYDFDGKRTVVEIAQIHVLDGGQDGSAASNDNTLFMNQGIFIP